MLIDPNTLTWLCDICHQERPDKFISVHKVDITPENPPLPPWTVTRNVKYCNDKPACFLAAVNQSSTNSAP